MAYCRFHNQIGLCLRVFIPGKLGAQDEIIAWYIRSLFTLSKFLKNVDSLVHEVPFSNYGIDQHVRCIRLCRSDEHVICAGRVWRCCAGIQCQQEEE